MTDFSGLTVLVTGAASGLGRTTALDFARRGARLAIADIQEAGLKDTQEQCAALGSEAFAFPCDLSQPDACTALIDQTVASCGSLDALVSVAGMLLLKHAADTTVAEWDKIFAVNVRAPFLLFQRALPHLLERSGAVVNVASASGIMGHAYIATYGASKGALIALTKNLATEFANTSLRINAVAPGAMNTPMPMSAMPPHDIDVRLLAKGMGFRPMAQPEDLTEMICYLASPKNRSVHGTVITIDQGTTG